MKSYLRRLPGVPIVPTRVFVSFEYGPLDDDQAFDPNDVTWFQLFTEDRAMRLVKVFDDETA